MVPSTWLVFSKHLLNEYTFFFSFLAQFFFFFFLKKVILRDIFAYVFGGGGGKCLLGWSLCLDNSSRLNFLTSSESVKLHLLQEAYANYLV